MILKKHHKDGDIRTVNRFLLFPKRIEYETRWLEWVTIKQRFNECSQTGDYWSNIEFITTEKHYVNDEM